LIALSLPAACAKKWNEGTTGDAWWGDPPLVEAFAECVDLLNYLDEAYRRGDLDALDWRDMRADVVALAERVRRAAR
jgi:hypothetical protein